jgi:hypothetical protein
VSDCPTGCLISSHTCVSARKRAYSAAETNAETSTEREQRGEVMPHHCEGHQPANRGRGLVESHR